MKFLTIAIASLLTVSPALAADESGITVSVKRLFETRSVDVIKTPGSSPSRNSMGLMLRFTGQPMESATRVGMLRITTAKDDQGKTLRSVYAISAPSTRMSKMSRARAIGKRPAPPLSQYDLTINMLAPGRSSTKIAEFAGEITFRISKTAGVTLPISQLTGLVGKAIDDANLKKLGITATVEKYTSKGSSTSLRLKIGGDKREKFLAARFVDGKGRIVDSSSYSFSSSRGTNSSTSSFRALPADTQLKITVETEFKDVKVKIDLKDIALP